MEPRTHSAEIITPEGSHVVMQGLTEAQADAIADQYEPGEVKRGVSQLPDR